MSDSIGDLFWAAIFGAVVLFFIFALSGALPADVRKEMHAEAARSGAGRYVVDPLTGATSFEWIDSRKAQESAR